MTTSTLDLTSLQREQGRICSVQVIEAAAGPARRRWLEEQAARYGARSFVVSCDFDMEGPWAGVKELVQWLLPDIQSERPELIAKHSPELTSALPSLRKTLRVHNRTLTDLAPDDEKVRGYPADRALRNVHGLIDLIDAWKRTSDEKTHWVIVCDDFEKAGTMSQHFFRELMRRRGAQLNLSLIVAVAPNEGEDARAAFHPSLSPSLLTLDLPVAPRVDPDETNAARLASSIEARIGDDPIEKEINLHNLIHLWQLARRHDKVLQLRRFATFIYFHDGLYADALRCNNGLLEMAAEYAPDDGALRREIVIRRLNALIGLQDAAASLKLVEEEALALADAAPFQWQADLFYLTAMVHARYSKPRNLEKGEEYLDRSLDAIKKIGLSEDKYSFQYVFNRNGVAMIRSFQRRAEDAIKLCQTGVETLDAHVRADKHRLHRSVLVYNTGQVYLAIAEYETALKYYSAAITMDPNFSEYYNERGGILLKLNRLEEAESDFLKAIELSPPYYEVFTNLAQCYRKIGKDDQAIEFYTRALDLEPKQVLALLGRAQTYEALGHRAEALADYTMALGYDSEQWEAFANRGVLHYEEGDLEAALADFTSAIRLSQEQASLYQNRSIVLTDLARFDDAARDLESALALSTSEDGRSYLQDQLESLRNKGTFESNQQPA